MNCGVLQSLCLLEFEHKDHCQLGYWLFLYHFNLDLLPKSEEAKASSASILVMSL